MKMMRIVFKAIVIYSLFFISCKETKNNKAQTTKSEKDTIVVDTKVKTNKVLNDTIGVYKLSNPDAKAYIVKMNEIIFEIEKAMANNTPNKMPELMKELNEKQKMQIKIQSGLSKSDEILFKNYVNEIGNKLIELGTKMNNM